MSSKRALLFRPEVEEGLELIWAYTASTWGVEQAEKYLDRLYNSMVPLMKYPEIRSLYKASTQEYRKIVVDKHIIYYRDTDKGILIVRILHSKMNRDNWL